MFVDFAFANLPLSKTTKSGLFSGGGLSFTIGKQTTETRTQTDDVNSYRPSNGGERLHTSMVGSVKKGNTTIIAGEKYTQTGSVVVLSALRTVVFSIGFC